MKMGRFWKNCERAALHEKILLLSNDCDNINFPSSYGLIPDFSNLFSVDFLIFAAFHILLI